MSIANTADLVDSAYKEGGAEVTRAICESIDNVIARDELGSARDELLDLKAHIVDLYGDIREKAMEDEELIQKALDALYDLEDLRIRSDIREKIDEAISALAKLRVAVQKY